MTRLALGLALLLVAAAPAAARPGDLDRSFGSKKGFTQPSFRSSETSGNALAVRASGRIVAVGTTRRPSQTPTYGFGEDHFAVALLDRNGRRASTRTFGFAPGAPHARAVAVAIQGRRAVIAGEGRSATDDQRFIALLGLTPTGALDRTFGDGGRVLLPLGDRSSAVTDMALDRAGRIVVAGELAGGMFVRRFLANGLPDMSFGDAGIALEPILPPAARVAVDRAGRVLVGGVDRDGRTLALTRLRSDGTRDTRFANDGIARRRAGSRRGSRLTDVVVLPDGGYAIAGDGHGRSSGDESFVVVRFTRGGAPARFGRDGLARRSIAYASAGPLVRQRGGAFVMAGARSYRTALVRFRPSGRVDTRFGHRGLRTIALGQYDGAGVSDAVLRGRRLVAIGTDSLDERIDYYSYMVVARFRL